MFGTTIDWPVSKSDFGLISGTNIKYHIINQHYSLSESGATL